jgi:hypothetical protein
VLKNAMIPVATVVGPAAAGLITGSFIIETFFSVPGIGREYVRSILALDYPVIMATTLLYAFFIIVANLSVDPRVRNARSADQGGEVMATVRHAPGARAAELNVLVRKQRSLGGRLYRLSATRPAVAGSSSSAPLHLARSRLSSRRTDPIESAGHPTSQWNRSGPASKYTDSRYLLGTDSLGRDIVSRLVYASTREHDRRLRADGDHVPSGRRPSDDGRLLRRLARSRSDAHHRHHLRVPGLPVPADHRGVVPQQRRSARSWTACC